MLFLLKFTPTWLIWLTVLAGCGGLVALRLLPQTPYSLLSKIVLYTTIAFGIFVLGADYAQNAQQTQIAKIEAKVEAVEAVSNTVNKTIETRVVTTIQAINVRNVEAQELVQQQLVPQDSQCVISPEFVNQHNSAAQKP